MNRNVNSEEGLHSCGYHDGKRATQPAQESLEDLRGALHRIDTVAVGLPTFEVRHEGGLDAFVQNIVDAIVALHEQRKPLTDEREWVGLTDDEIKDIIGSWGDTPIKGYTRKLFDQIEAKLKEKNND